MLNELINIPETPLSKEDYRTWIESLQADICQIEGAMDRHESINHGYTLEEALTPGIYVREYTMPAEQLVISKVHLQTHPFLITKGKVSVYNGEEVVTYEAPYKGVTPAGTKRILYTHTETSWITFHPTDSDELEIHDKNGVITCDTFEEYEEITGGKKCLSDLQQ